MDMDRLVDLKLIIIVSQEQCGLYTLGGTGPIFAIDEISRRSEQTTHGM